MKTKICSSPDCACQGQPQPIENFYKNSFGVGGFHSTCKDCKNRHVRAKYHSSPEIKAAVVAKTKTYQQSERGKAVMRKARLDQQKKNPDKAKAREAVSGKIVNNKNGNGLIHPSKLGCVYCGKQASQYHHHNGYEKEHWLDVVPVCTACHYSLHLKEH